MTLWNILELNTEVQCVPSVCWALIQRQIPPLHAVRHSLHTKPAETHHPDRSTKARLLNQRAARSPSILELLGEEVQRMKVTGMKCSLGKMPNSSRWDNGCNPFDYRRLWWKWTNKSEQPRVNIPWCLLSKLLTQVAFSLSVRTCLRPVYASGEPSLTPVHDSGDNMPGFCL